MLKRCNDHFFEISHLISRSLSGELNEEEFRTLETWKNQSSDNHNLYERIVSEETIRSKIYWYRDNRVQPAFTDFIKKRQNRNKRLRRHRIYRVAGYAAIVVVSIFISLHYFHSINDERSLTSEKFVRKNVPTLTLTSGKQILLNRKNIDFSEEKNVQIVRREEGGMAYQPIGTHPTELTYHTLTTPALCDYSLTLSDGTKVWLNAQSSLRYPVVFSGDERVVYASGEVYLEVAKDKIHPFYVVLDDMRIEVVGTSFNINAYADNKFIEVTLREGRLVAHVENQNYSLESDHQLVLDKEQKIVRVTSVNAGDYISWREGKYIFKGKTLGEIAKVAERWYDIRIVFADPAIEQIGYTGIILKDEPVETFMSRLSEISPYKAYKDKDVIYIR